MKIYYNNNYQPAYYKHSYGLIAFLMKRNFEKFNFFFMQSIVHDNFFHAFTFYK